MATRPTIRRAQTAETDTVTRHRDAMFAEMGIDAGVVAAASGPARTWLAAALADGRYVGLLAESGGAVIGGIGITWLDLPPNMNTQLDRRGYLLNMFVEPVARSQGVARALLRAALDECRAQGVDCVSLHASDAGRSLYESSGFSPTNEMRLRLA